MTDTVLHPSFQVNCEHCQSYKDGMGCSFHLGLWNHDHGLCSHDYSCFFCPPIPFGKAGPELVSDGEA